MTRWMNLILILIVALLPACGSGKPAQSGSPAQKSESRPSGQAPAPAAKASPTDMTFRNYGNNPATSAPRESASTFGVDVDTASYTLARNYLERGVLPPPEAVRVEEFINYFPQNYPAPLNQAVAVYLDGGPSPFRPGWHLVNVGLKAREVSRSERKPAVLTFVIDVSGSMNMENRLGLVKRSLHLLLDQLRSGDRVGIVTYGTRGAVALEHTSEKSRIRSAIDRLAPEGSTNAEEGLLLGYDLAYRGYREGATNRIILCSDGVANVGQTGPEAILRRVEDFRTRGITLTTVGFGMGNYNDVLMEQLADKGDGHYAYVDSLDAARKVFVEELTGTLELVAKDAKVQVRFNPEEVAAYRLVGYENRVLRNEDFRNEQADAGEMGAGHTVTALYELQVRSGGSGDLGRVAVRYKDPASGEVLEVDKPVKRNILAASGAGASAELRWTASVAEFAGILKGNPWASESSLNQVYAVARRASSDLDGMPRYQEFLDLVQQAMRLITGPAPRRE